MKKKAKVYWAEENLRLVANESTPASLKVNYQNKDANLLFVETDLTGLYQTLNVRTVLTAVEVLRSQGWRLNEDRVLSALKNVKGLTGFAGRWDVIQQHPTVVLDVAHNQNGIEKLVEQLRQLKFDNLHIVYGMVKDKEIENVLALLPTNARYYFTQADIPRALPAEDLQQKARKFDLKGDIYANVNIALQAAKSVAGKNDLIIVCGSIFLVAEVAI